MNNLCLVSLDGSVCLSVGGGSMTPLTITEAISITGCSIDSNGMRNAFGPLSGILAMRVFARASGTISSLASKQQRVMYK